MTLFGQLFYNLGSDEAAASNHDDLHFASPFILRLSSFYLSDCRLGTKATTCERELGPGPRPTLPVLTAYQFSS